MALSKSTCVQDAEEAKDEKPQVEIKSSMEILSELFSTFDAEPPVIVKKEKEDELKKHKKGKNRHKHKDKREKKHRRKPKRKRRKSDESSTSDSEGIDLSELIKTEITETVLLGDSLQKFIKSEINPDVKEEPKESGSKEKIAKDSSIVSENNNSLKENRNPSKISHTEEKKRENTKVEIKNSKASSLPKNDKNEKCNTRKRHEHDKHDHTLTKKRKMSRSYSRSRSKSRERPAKKSDKHRRSRDRSRSRSPKSKHDRCKDTESGHKKEHKYKSDHRSYDNRNNKSREEPKKERDTYRNRHETRKHESKDDGFYKNNLRSKDRRRTRDRERSPRSCERETRFDKKKLLEIARKNAIQMMKSGKLSDDALTLGPQAQEKVIAAISGGGKTIEELTDFCKTLSKKEALGELSSVSSRDGSGSEEEDMAIRHPFQIKEKSFTINIKNSVPLPTRTNQERASELRIQFPVSSGQLHRKTESEWVPVSNRKTDASYKPTSAALSARATPLAIEAAPPVPHPNPPTSNTQGRMAQTSGASSQSESKGAPAQESEEIASIVTQRLAAMRKLQENPCDSQAIEDMHCSQQGMNTWAESKLPLGQFTGSTGANILSQAQLASGYQAWARKDQLQTAAPLSGGMGMHLLQKMGWRPGEGLGKEKTGTLEPLLLEVKLDKKGVIAKGEGSRKSTAIRIPKQSVKTLEGKHPVSLLHEYASKRKLGAPVYVLDFECGPDHMKNFLFKVRLNGAEYKPNVASGNKKDAKALAATTCLQTLGLLHA